MHGNEFPGQTAVSVGVKDYGITYPAVDDAQSQIYKAYGISSQPSWALIGKDGTITKRQVGGAAIPQVEQLIQTALQ